MKAETNSGTKATTTLGRTANNEPIDVQRLMSIDTR
jgi:hypothetical protein